MAAKKAAPASTATTRKSKRLAGEDPPAPPPPAKARKTSKAPKAQAAAPPVEDDEESGAADPAPKKKTGRGRRAKIVDPPAEDDDGSEAETSVATRATTTRKQKAATGSQAAGPSSKAAGKRPVRGGPAKKTNAAAAGDEARVDAEAVVAPPADTDPASPAQTDNEAEANADAGLSEELLADEYRNAPRMAPDVEDVLDIEDFRRGQATLRTVLRVHQDLQFSARLGYAAKLYLTRTAGADVPEEHTTEQQVGYIHAWRIDKASDRNGNQARPAWVAQFLKNNFDAMDESGTELAMCLRALHTQTGGLRKPLQDKNLQGRLVNDSVMFVQMVYIDRRFTGGGLAGHAFDRFYHLLTQLSEWYYFTGTFILVPCLPEGPRGASWEGKSDEEVEVILRRVYEKYDYGVYVLNANVLKSKITVMGRPAPPEPAKPGPASGSG